MIRLRQLLICFFVIGSVLLINASEPSAFISHITAEQNTINNGCKGVTLKCSVGLSGMIGRKVGIWGYITDLNNQVIAKSTYQDITFIDKVETSNMPYVSTFIPIDNLPDAKYKAYVTAYDYSITPPKVLDTHNCWLRPKKIPSNISIQWKKLPTAQDRTVTVHITSEQPIKHLVLCNKVIPVNEQKSITASTNIENKFGCTNLDVACTLTNGEKIQQTRVSYIQPPVIIQNISIVQNAYGGSFHRVTYDAKTTIPIGSKYGIQASIGEVTGTINGIHQTRQIYQGKLILKSAIQDSENFKDAEILIPTAHCQLNPSKEYVVTILPYIFNNDNWSAETSGMFSSAFNSKVRSEDLIPDDNSHLRFDWLACPPETNQNKIQIKIGIKSPNEIKGTNLTVNGQKMRGVSLVANDGYDMVITETIALAEGTNEIRISAKNANGIGTSTRSIVRNPSNKDISTKVTSSHRRAALIIGNASYPGNELFNTCNDASDLAAKLQTLGFDVMLLKNCNKAQTEQAIDQFASKAALMDAAFFFFAGHGMQINGTNYVIPVDANFNKTLDLTNKCTSLDYIINKLDNSGCGLKIIALDACRNNPFASTYGKQGLSIVNTAAAVGTVISFATAPGSVASDGSGRNSPYTTALLSVLDEPSLSIDQIFNSVGKKVMNLTNRRQQPWMTKTVIEQDFFFNPHH